MLALKVLGAGRHVGRSANVVHLDGSVFLLDCGIQIGSRHPGDQFPDLASLFIEIPTLSRQLSHDYDSVPFSHGTTDGEGLPVSTLFTKETGEWEDGVCKFLPLFPASRYRCQIDAVLITHCHLDHLAALPYFTEVLGFTGPVFMTPATFRQARLQLEDCWLTNSNLPLDRSCIEESIGEENNSSPSPGDHTNSARNDSWAFTRIAITREMIDRCLKKVHLIVPTDGFGARLQTSAGTWINNVRLQALFSGHVPGACMFFLQGQASGESVLYTGDYTLSGEQLLYPAQFPAACPSLLISESTYGSQVRDSKVALEHEICAAAAATVRGGGKVLIPMSSVGKAQELAVLLALHWEQFGMTVPIILGTGMMQNATQALWKPDLVNTWTTPLVVSRGQVPRSAALQSTAKPSDHLAALLQRHVSFMDGRTVLVNYGDSPDAGKKNPVVYLCSPRSLAAGPALAALRAWGQAPDNLIILIGFSVPGTVAHQLIQGSKTLNLPVDTGQPTTERSRHGLPFAFKAKMRYFSLASHSDSLAIQTYVKYVSPAVTVLVHGEAEGMKLLGRQLEVITHRPVWRPRNNETLVLKLPLTLTRLKALLHQPEANQSTHQPQQSGRILNCSDSGEEVVGPTTAALSTSADTVHPPTACLWQLLLKCHGHVEKWLDLRYKRHGAETKSEKPLESPTTRGSSFLVTREDIEQQVKKWCPALQSSLDTTLSLPLPLEDLRKALGVEPLPRAPDQFPATAKKRLKPAAPVVLQPSPDKLFQQPAIPQPVPQPARTAVPIDDREEGEI